MTKKKKCKDCKFDQANSCSVDDVHHEYTGQLLKWTGKDKNEKGECPKFKEPIGKC